MHGAGPAPTFGQSCLFAEQRQQPDKLARLHLEQLDARLQTKHLTGGRRTGAKERRSVPQRCKRDATRYEMQRGTLHPSAALPAGRRTHGRRWRAADGLQEQKARQCASDCAHVSIALHCPTVWPFARPVLRTLLSEYAIVGNCTPSAQHRHRRARIPLSEGTAAHESHLASPDAFGLARLRHLTVATRHVAFAVLRCAVASSRSD